jgi:hypothetical protein
MEEMIMRNMRSIILLGMVMLLCAGCSSNSDGSNSSSLISTPTTETAQTVALAKEGCSIVDTDTNYSIMSGGENAYGKNYVSKKGDQIGFVETLPGSITIKCGDQIHNFVFADNTEQSVTITKANEMPVGDINAFFKTDKKTDKNIQAYITEKIAVTSLCRFSAYPAFTGTIESEETLSVTASGIECGTPQWYINGNSIPIEGGNSLVVGADNLSYGENDITVKVTNPAGTNSLYIKRILAENQQCNGTCESGTCSSGTCCNGTCGSGSCGC